MEDSIINMQYVWHLFSVAQTQIMAARRATEEKNQKHKSYKMRKKRQ